MKRLNCTFAFFCLPAVWYYWWRLVPRNEVEGVSAQSDGDDSNHQAICKKIFAWLWVFIWKTASFCSQYLIFCLYLSIVLCVCLTLFHSLCTCVHYVCFAEHAVCPWGVYQADILGTSRLSIFKFYPKATLDPCLHCKNTKVHTQ